MIHTDNRARAFTEVAVAIASDGDHHYRRRVGREVQIIGGEATLTGHLAKVRETFKVQHATRIVGPREDRVCVCGRWDEDFPETYPEHLDVEARWII